MPTPELDISTQRIGGRAPYEVRHSRFWCRRYGVACWAPCVDGPDVASGPNSLNLKRAAAAIEGGMGAHELLTSDRDMNLRRTNHARRCPGVRGPNGGDHGPSALSNRTMGQVDGTGSHRLPL